MRALNNERVFQKLSWGEKESYEKENQVSNGEKKRKDFFLTTKIKIKSQSIQKKITKRKMVV